MRNSILKPAVMVALACMTDACHQPDRLTVKNYKQMFTAEEVKAAHAKVKSGADFPAYIKEINAHGVTHYEAYVADGHIDYHGANGYTAKVPAKYDPLKIAETSNQEAFKAELIAHQQGKTDFLTFIKACATFGIEKWAICMDMMTCTYYDKAGNKVLTEEIPR